MTFESDAPRQAADLAGRILESVRKAVIGNDAVVQQLLVAILARGHVLLEGVPGTAKTLLVKTLAISLGMEFKRAQMTPDLMPSDILGTSVFELATRTFHFQPGPVFTTVLLADEINRAPAKTQSALLEAMQERQVTVDGERRPLPSDFTVFATQNPVEYEGTYPLPEAQLDRFMLKILVPYLEPQAEDDLLARYNEGFDADRLDEAGVTAVTSADELGAVRREIRGLVAEPGLLHYVGEIVRATRIHPNLVLGCSPRAGVMLLQAAKSLAALRGRTFVTPDDVKDIALPVLRHRVILRPEAEIEGIGADDVIRNVLAAVEVPR
ncbi:MAG: MoxR family ATPase [Armatimonadetes bacterium]|nr:MoxR family ATPase [Armatimonadota bacterium]